MRCSVLADELMERGWNCIFLSREYDGQGVECLGKKYPLEMMVGDVSLADDLSRTMTLIRSVDARVLITDSYEFDAAYLKNATTSGVLTVNMDDCGWVRQSSDLVLNQNATAFQVKYDCEVTTGFLLGSEYVLIRSDLKEARRAMRPIPKEARHVLVTLGGGKDQGNVTGKIIDALMPVSAVTCDIVVGPGHSHLKALDELCRESEGRLTLQLLTDRMGELMVKADLMLSAGGTTSWERCYFGVPGFMIVLAEDQEPNAKYLHAKGAAINLGWAKDLTIESIRQNVEAMIPDMSGRVQMRLCGQKLVDGSGVAKVVDEIERRVGR